MFHGEVLFVFLKIIFLCSISSWFLTMYIFQHTLSVRLLFYPTCLSIMLTDVVLFNWRQFLSNNFQYDSICFFCDRMLMEFRDQFHDFDDCLVLYNSMIFKDLWMLIQDFDGLLCLWLPPSEYDLLYLFDFNFTLCFHLLIHFIIGYFLDLFSLLKQFHTSKMKH